MGFGLLKQRALKKQLKKGDVDFTGTNIGTSGAKAVARGLSGSSSGENAVTRVCLFMCHVGDEGAESLGDALRANSTVALLYLTSNSIGDKGAQCLADALRENNTVRVLDLSMNAIGDKGAQYLADALRENHSLTELWLADNSIGDEGAQCLADALRDNSAVEKLVLENNADISSSLLVALQSEVGARLVTQGALDDPDSVSNKAEDVAGEELLGDDATLE
jgi:Leucine Rich repeat